MARRTAVFQFSVRGAGHTASKFDRGARRLQDELIRALRRISTEAHEVFLDHAPEDTGQLHDAIKIVPFYRARFPRVRLAVERLRSHGDDGRFDYLNVTRFGHRKTRIKPRRSRFLKVHVWGHDDPDFILRRSVRGVRPSSDWVADAARELEPMIAGESEFLGRRIERRVIV